jgi:cytochrome c oxidase cbb3-type subunit 3
MWKKLVQILTRSTPVEKEKDILLNHDYDGITELDNVLPPWWLWLFIITVIWAAIYMIRYHVATDWSQDMQYDQEMAIAKAEVDAYLTASGLNVDAASAVIMDDQASLIAGEEIYKAQCLVCHRADGGGLIGPNLTDDIWIHGGEIGDLFAVISNGVLEKGMQSYRNVLSPVQMQQVASYILVNLKGTEPENPFVYPGDPR